MSCAVTRTVFAERRTLPSRTAPTLSLCAAVTISGCSLNEKDEVRAATCSPSISARELSSSSVSPSEKYSCSLSPLRFTNGSTAIECGGGLKAVGGAPARAAVSGVACLGAQNLLARKYASAARTTAASRTGFDLREARIGSLIAGASPDTALTGESSGDS